MQVGCSDDSTFFDQDVPLPSIVNSYAHWTGDYKWEQQRGPSGIWKGTIRGEVICFSACDRDQLAFEDFDGIHCNGCMIQPFYPCSSTRAQGTW